MKLSILIPVYNERYLVGELVQRVLAAPLPEGMERELIIVDDGSTDGTRGILERLAAEQPAAIRYLPHERNQGKGGALRTAIAAARGDFCIFQDADLEYDPNDYGRLLAPLLSGEADVVYGSRFLPSECRRVLYFRHSLGNHLLTFLSNLFSDLCLTDMETCYKVFRTEVLKTIPIRSNDFRIEPEITAKVAKRGLRVYEVPIRYYGRTYAEGKKITWRDGYRALGTILKYWLVDDLYTEAAGHEILSSLSRAHHFNRWMADAVRPFLGHRVLEIGAGIGNLTVCLQPREEYIASELDEAHLRVLHNLALRRPALRIARLDAACAADFAPFKGRVDTVVCLNVLEHIPEAAAALRNLHDVLAPGGRAVVLVPQGPRLYGPLDQALAHVRRYRASELCAALSQAGFRTEALFDFNRVGTPGWLFQGKVRRGTRLSRTQLKLYDSLVWLWRRTDWLLPWPGLSVIAVGRKEGQAGAAPGTAEAAD